MSLLYTIVQKGNPVDSKQPKKYHLQSKIRGSKSHKQILETASKNTTVNKKEIDNGVYAFIEAMFDALEDGFSVEVEGLGTFSTSLSSEGVSSEAEANASKVKSISLVFRSKPEARTRVGNFKLEKYNPGATL